MICLRGVQVEPISGCRNRYSMNMYCMCIYTVFRHECVLAREPDHIAYFERQRPYLISHSFLAVRPRHPFVRSVLEHLQNIHVKSMPFADTFLSDRLHQYSLAANNKCLLPPPQVVHSLASANSPLDLNCSGCVLLPWHSLTPSLNQFFHEKLMRKRALRTRN